MLASAHQPTASSILRDRSPRHSVSHVLLSRVMDRSGRWGMNTHLLLLLPMGASQGPTLARCAGVQELVSLGAQDRGRKDPAHPISGPPAQAPSVSPGVKRAGDPGLGPHHFHFLSVTSPSGMRPYIQNPGRAPFPFLTVRCQELTQNWGAGAVNRKDRQPEPVQGVRGTLRPRPLPTRVHPSLARLATTAGRLLSL